MEDDDEFGDLYTDVLRQFQPSSVPPMEQPKHPSPQRPIDLNVQSNDEEILLGASDPKPQFNFTVSHQTQDLVLKSTNYAPEPGIAQSSDSRLDLNQDKVKDEGLAEGVINWATDLQDPIVNRVLENGGNGKLQEKVPKSMGECGVDFVVEERSDKDICLVEKDQGLIDKEEKFDIEEEDPVIPGVSDAADHRGEGNDWDSDSDDGLNIVLNETNHGPTVMEGLVGSGDEDDEDGTPLVIVADSESGHIPMEEREWGEDAAQAADGERKELGEAAKVNGVAVGAPKIVYNSNFSYQPYHSQFKYVRPGATPIPGAPGQIRPPVNMGPVSGFGRGDWRPTGIRNTSPMQKSSHPGFGMNGGWGNGTTGRGFGSGLDFTLPSHKTIFEVGVDSFEEKPWRLPGLDMSDFFNFGLNEESWKVYFKQLEQLRVETTMQSKIRVYESGRTEQEYDPDLPPELAAAAAGAAGIRDISSENANIGNSDGGQIGVAKGSTDVRPSVPIGRAIQVETSYVERLPSTDTRPLRIRDSDVIIEIVLQGSTDDTSLPGNDATEKPENEPLRENFKGGRETNGDVTGEALLPYRLNSSEQPSACPGRDGGTLHEESQKEERACDRSPIMVRSGSILDKDILGNQNEDSVDSIGGKHSNLLSSPVTVGSAEEPDIEHGDALHGRSGMSDREEMALDRTTLTDTHIAGNPLPSVKKRKLSSRVEQSPGQEIGDRGNLKAAKSRENSIARSDSSRDYHKLRYSTDEEVVQHGRSTRMGNIKRPLAEDEQNVRIKCRDERRKVEKHYMAEKGWEDSYSHQYLDPRSTRHLHMKTEGIDRKKGGENSEGAWQRRDDNPHGRRTRVEETRNKVREREKMDKDEHFQLRKQLGNGNSRVYHDKDVGSRPREMDDNLKYQYESMNDHYSKRSKEEDYSIRDGEKEEMLHNHKENLARRKRERDDALAMRKRDLQVRTREDIYSSVRHKEDGWIHRERDQMHKIKQSHEESLSKREREEWREGVRKSGRSAEEKTWIPNARVKDEYKSDRDYQFKDTGRRNEQHKRRVEDGSLSQHRGREDLHSTRGSQLNKDERRSRHERESTRRELVGGGSVNNRMHEKNRKENASKDSEVDDHNSGDPSTRNQEGQNGHVNERAILKGKTEKGKHNEDASDDDKQRDSRRGRSKLERWTGHKERDFNIDSSSSSTKVKEIDKYKNGASNLLEESFKTIETIDDPHPLGDRRGQKEEKSVNGRHSDTVDKLKQRRERFKLPMPRDKEAMGIKRMEGESLPSAQSEDSEIKTERPPRKRRWISN